MKTKEVIDSKILNEDKLNSKTKPKSLRPMRSMVAIRSLKPRTQAAAIMKPEVEASRN